jgi:hypothetical protein
MTERGAKHTPGPWNLVWWGNEKYPYPLSSLADNDGKWIARDGTVSSEANARLIAAAPDLLAACRAALGAFFNNNAIDWSELEEAIAKAEGRS